MSSIFWGRLSLLWGDENRRHSQTLTTSPLSPQKENQTSLPDTDNLSPPEPRNPRNYRVTDRIIWYSGETDSETQNVYKKKRKHYTHTQNSKLKKNSNTLMWRHPSTIGTPCKNGKWTAVNRAHFSWLDLFRSWKQPWTDLYTGLFLSMYALWASVDSHKLHQGPWLVHLGT